MKHYLKPFAILKKLKGALAFYFKQQTMFYNGLQICVRWRFENENFYFINKFQYGKQTFT